MMKREPHECMICKRITPLEYQEKHHLIPKCRKGKEKIMVCKVCGDQLHQIFTIKELEHQYNSICNILLNKKIQNWIKWINKKPISSHVCMKHKKKKIK